MNEFQRKRGYPCDSQEWFFKILGAPEYKEIWAPTRKENKTSESSEEKMKTKRCDICNCEVEKRGIKEPYWSHKTGSIFCMTTVATVNGTTFVRKSCKHTEHTIRAGFGQVGRYFEDMNDVVGSWERCSNYSEKESKSD